MAVKISKEQGNLVFVIMPKLAREDFYNRGNQSPDTFAKNAIEQFLTNRSENPRGCVILPYPSNFAASLVRTRVGEVQRTGYHNVDFGRGEVKEISSLNLTWDKMNLRDMQILKSLVFANEFWLYYLDSATNTMRANLFYCEDDGLQKGEVWVEFDEDDAIVTGYKNVQIEFIATLNDHKEVLRARGIAYDVDGDEVGGGSYEQ